ncbi:hypothetical protein PACTADRAFT_48549 [Pachysolen tannophilus NRRL Y-2460]|uniref:DNA repair protein RAD33 n=1 Tax=Pachysolen tannophilus NRRL Y-2460 TaxID=669874 RepID=A0A1E4TY93_PACTA|nr:hypothetical protein PACTADRAFT_48549 [Pachysolen tannophilus NRRL Y-2460]
MPQKKKPSSLSALSNTRKFNENPFNVVSTTESRIPSSIEDLILDKYTDFCYNSDTEDLESNQLFGFLKNYLKIPDVLLQGFNPTRYQIDGETNVVDIDKLVKYGGLLLIMKNNLEIIKSYWKLLVKYMSDDFNLQNDKEVFEFKIHLDDLMKLRDSINDDSNENALIDMIAVGSDGEKVFVNFVDFGKILGKIGELNF